MWEEWSHLIHDLERQIMVLRNTKCQMFFLRYPLSFSCCLTTGLLSHWWCFSVKQPMLPAFVVNPFFAFVDPVKAACWAGFWTFDFFLELPWDQGHLLNHQTFVGLEGGNRYRHSAGLLACPVSVPVVVLIWQRWRRGLRPPTKAGALVFKHSGATQHLVAGQPSVLLNALKSEVTFGQYTATILCIWIPMLSIEWNRLFLLRDFSSLLLYSLFAPSLMMMLRDKNASCLWS